MNSDKYVEELEKENEELRNNLAKELEFSSDVGSSMYVIRVVFGWSGGKIDHEHQSICFSLNDLKNCIKHFSKIKYPDSSNYRFLGFEIEQPERCYVRGKQYMGGGYSVQYFDCHFSMIEGFTYEDGGWSYLDSGNSMVFNKVFVDQIYEWANEGKNKI